jgi:hypothetical protein
VAYPDELRRSSIRRAVIGLMGPVAAFVVLSGGTSTVDGQPTLPVGITKAVTAS